MSFPDRVTDIQAMISLLVPGGWHQISFEVGKLGRVDRFVLKYGRPMVEVMDLCTDTPEESGAVLKILDDLLDTDPEFGVLYNNPRTPRYAYCLWCKPIDSSGKRPDWFLTPKILPIYQRRMLEQQRIFDGTLKRGHKDFGFFPLDGFR